jgi:hypothetical protein
MVAQNGLRVLLVLSCAWPQQLVLLVLSAARPQQLTCVDSKLVWSNWKHTSRGQNEPHSLEAQRVASCPAASHLNQPLSSQPDRPPAPQPAHTTCNTLTSQQQQNPVTRRRSGESGVNTR